jgi:hypothetical protein
VLDRCDGSSCWRPVAAFICSGGEASIGLMPSARPRLVGRRDEMAALEDEFARAAAGEFRVVLLLGEAERRKPGWGHHGVTHG